MIRASKAARKGHRAVEGAARCPHFPGPVPTLPRPGFHTSRPGFHTSRPSDHPAALFSPLPRQAAAPSGVTRRRDGRKSGRNGAGLVSHRAQIPLSALFSRDFVGFRPQRPPESAPPGASGRRRAVSESSYVAPMHAASLTKGYGGNPPSGRSVSPPRTGPFFLARRPAPCARGPAPCARRAARPAG